MSNIWSLFEDYEKRYHGWLKESAVPKTTQWYNQSGIEEGLLGINENLFGRQIRTKHPTEGVISTNQGGGSLDTAGGVIKDYFQRPTMQQHPNQQYGTYKGTAPFQRDAADAGVKALELTKSAVKKGVGFGNELIADWFPALAGDKRISNVEKNQLNEQIKAGKIDPNLVRGLKDKTGAANDKDISTFEKFLGINKEDVAKEWKDKNGFEGLMSNPAFTLGLAIMQSSAQGQTIGQGVMDNFIKAAGISEHYKDRIKARTEVLGPPTKAERELAEGALSSIGITGPGFLKGKIWDNVKLWGKDNDAEWQAGLNKIVTRAKTMINKKYEGKTHQVTEADYQWALKKLEGGGELKEVNRWFGVTLEQMKKKKRKGSWEQWIDKKLGEGNIITRAEGGPIQAGQPAIVGEKGPEVIVPKTDVNVISNDDSQVMGMLLASNPQLQNVSKSRAESILRSRFPDYFA